MRREELYLTDIAQAAESIQRFLAGVEREIFLQDDLLQSAVLQKLTIIGEERAYCLGGTDSRGSRAEAQSVRYSCQRIRRPWIVLTLDRKQPCAWLSTTTQQSGSYARSASTLPFLPPPSLPSLLSPVAFLSVPNA